MPRHNITIYTRQGFPVVDGVGHGLADMEASPDAYTPLKTSVQDRGLKRS